MSKAVQPSKAGALVPAVRKSGLIVAGGISGGVAGAGTVAAVGFLLAGPPGAAIGFLVGLFGGLVGGAYAGKKAEESLFE